MQCGISFIPPCIPDRVEFVNDAIYSSEVSLVNIIVLNVHAPSEEKSNYSKDSLYDEVE